MADSWMGSTICEALYLVKNSLSSPLAFTATGMGETDSDRCSEKIAYWHRMQIQVLSFYCRQLSMTLYAVFTSSSIVRLLLEMDSSANAIERLIPTLISFVSRSVNFDLFCGSSRLPLFVI